MAEDSSIVPSPGEKGDFFGVAYVNPSWFRFKTIAKTSGAIYLQQEGANAKANWRSLTFADPQPGPGNYLLQPSGNADGVFDAIYVETTTGQAWGLVFDTGTWNIYAIKEKA